LFDIYQYGEAGRQIDDFLWGEFADWYIEISKYPLYQGSDVEKQNARRVLVYVLDQSLRLLHPFMPFVTEELWQYLPHEGKAMIVARWPQSNAAYIDAQAESQINTLIDLVRGIRNVRNEYNVEPGRKITAIVEPGSYADAIRDYSYLFARLANVAEVTMRAQNESAPAKAASVVVSDVTFYLPLADFVDTAAECERLTREREKLQEQIARSDAMLANEGFVSRARPDVVERERAKRADLQASAAQIDERLAALCG
jgi:valyl-tRNA synthetase